MEAVDVLKFDGGDGEGGSSEGIGAINIVVCENGYIVTITATGEDGEILEWNEVYDDKHKMFQRLKAGL